MPRRYLQLDLVNLSFRVATALVTGLFVYRLGSSYWAHPQRVTLMLLLVSELATLLTILLSRRPTIRDLNPAYMLLTVVASFIVPLFVRAEGTTHLLPETLSSGIVIAGLLWTIYAKVSLGRSFGLLAAQRIIKVKGAYRFVRHPIYAGYFLVHVGYLMANCNWENAFIIVTFYAMQVMRALREEKILSHDKTYQSYCQVTKYRFIYGVI